jgi:hypothetical protein
MFDDVTTGLVHCHLHRIDAMFVQVGGFSGTGDKFADDGQAIVAAGKSERLRGLYSWLRRIPLRGNRNVFLRSVRL